MSLFPSKVKIVEVGPRDGLQSEVNGIDSDTRAEFINKLAAAGLMAIEAGSFVNPQWVPQMEGTDQVFAKIHRANHVVYSALVPNLRGYGMAVNSGADEVAIFAAASENFSLKNINCSIDESIDRFVPILQAAKTDNIPVRGYISCIAGCPYGGHVSPKKVAELSLRLVNMGCYEISLADTTGVGTPDAMAATILAVKEHVGVERLAVHCHDTYGHALANIDTALQLGVAVIDSSVSGLGGCPYAPDSAGNVATEDVITMLNDKQIMHGVNLSKLLSAGQFIDEKLGRTRALKTSDALLSLN